MTVLVLHRLGPLAGAPYRTWLSDYDGDIMLLAGQEFLDVIGADLLMGGDYAHAEAVAGYDNNGRVEARCQDLAAQHDLRHLVACQELDLERAAQLREILGLPGPARNTLIPFRDKKAMKDLAAAAGLAVPAYRDLQCATDLLAFVAEHGLPVVLKPRDGAGSVGVRVLRTEAELNDYLDTQFDLFGPYQPNLLVETFVNGTMAHVDGLVLDGRIVTIWPSQYQYSLATFATDRRGRMDLTLDSDDPLAARLVTYTEQLLDALPGAADFAFHVEIFHTPDDRLLLCEIAARAGGAGVRDLHHALFDLDLSETVVRSQLGLPLPPRLRAGRLRPVQLAGQFVLMKRPGRVVARPDGPPPFDWVTQFRVFIRPGQVMAAAAHSADFMALAIVVGPDRRTCEQRLRRVEEWFLAGLVLELPEPGPASGTTLVDLLAAQVAERPEAPAVVSGAEQLTYTDLADRAGRVAGHLRDLGVSADDRVGLFVEPSVDLMTGIWGVLRAGAAYLPLSPEYPDERLRYMIEDAGVRLVLTQEHLRAPLAALIPVGVQIRTVPEAVAAGPPAAGARPGAADLAYVIHTSGSTGRPKGVMVEHRQVVSQLRWLSRAGYLGPARTVLQKTPMSFDAAQWEILAPACGSTVVMGDPGLYRDPERLIAAVVRHGVTTLQGVPTLLQALVEHEGFARCVSLRQIFSGGEVLTRSLAQRILAARPECELINLYGPTECTINTSAYPVNRAVLADGSTVVPIGHPVDRTVYHVLDPARSPVPDGEVGELYIGGAHVTRGYLGRPELTAERFVANPLPDAGTGTRLFRTGDLVRRTGDDPVEFIGRTDNQVKLRGYRIELDEIRSAVEDHPWVRSAAVVVAGTGSGAPTLVAFIELSTREAALMDQGSHGDHHQSKQSRLQVKAQLANLGHRTDRPPETQVVDLPGRAATAEQRRLAYSRKTYRFYEGGSVRRADLEHLFAGRTPPPAPARSPGALSLAELGHLLRYLGAHRNDERLLPKYAYASPGALYATQVYVEVNGVAGLASGAYYYHPVEHRLILIRERPSGDPDPTLRLHLVGRRRAIEPVYRNNIREVLQIEAGHIVGLLERILPGYGLSIEVDDQVETSVRDLRCADEDYHLGSFRLGPAGPTPASALEAVEIHVQSHPGRIPDLPPGRYHYRDGRLEPVGDQIVARHHMIAINQQVYDRASFGITVVARNRDWRAYIDLGRALQMLAMNEGRLGFMSAGYSSESGDQLPAARRIESLLGSGAATYFFLGGRVSAEQWDSEGMNEDTVHMRGPAEMVRDDLVGLLPPFMIPNRVVVLDALPRIPNGKVDARALAAEGAAATAAAAVFVAPRSRTERRVARIWQEALKRSDVSVHDDFFAAGGQSLIAVRLVNELNREFGGSLPVQIVFERPTIAALADSLAEVEPVRYSRLVRLADGTAEPVFCWPGLGGYPMNLRPLANRLALGRPFYGVQTHGLNPGESPHSSVAEAVAADLELIRRVQPEGPYTLWGYSFGARPAFEAARRLQQAGERVDDLVLIAPGAPVVDATGAGERDRPAFDNKVYLTILFSVFAGTTTGPEVEECLATVEDEAGFVAFVSARYPELDIDLMPRILAVVRRTFSLSYRFQELRGARIEAPVTVIKARGDDYSFIESSGGYASAPPIVHQLQADHYGLLRNPGIDELVRVIREGPPTRHRRERH